MSKSNLNIEKSFVIGLVKGDQKSFRGLFDLYSKPLYAFALSYLKSKDAAEDVVQEVFSKIWSNRKNLKTGTSFKSYLFTLALNSIRKQFNSLSKLNEAKHEILYQFSLDESDFDQKDNYQTLLNRLEELIERLPERRKQIFIKKKLEEKSLREIAEELSITTKTVEYHITEAMKFLKTEFEQLRISGMIFFHLFIQN